MNKQDKIYIAGHRGMVGSAITRKLEQEGFQNLVFSTSQELDLRDQQAVNDFFEAEKPEYVFLAAAKVGGIMANNTYRAEFLYDNLMIESNIIHAAWKQSEKLMFLGFILYLSKNGATTIERRISADRKTGTNQ